MKSIFLKPASYSKSKTVNDIVYNIGKHPLQDTNNEQAYLYSIEFVVVDSGSTSVGTLSEYSVDKFEEYVIQADDGVVTVTQQGDKFIVRDKFIVQKSDIIDLRLKAAEEALLLIMEDKALVDELYYEHSNVVIKIIFWHEIYKANKE